MNKISLFCALALIGSTAFALDKAGCVSLKDVKILNNEMKDGGVRAATAQMTWTRLVRLKRGTKRAKRQRACWHKARPMLTRNFQCVPIQRWLHTQAVTQARHVALFVNKFRWKFDTSKILQICFCVYNVSIYGIFYVICAHVSKSWLC